MPSISLRPNTGSTTPALTSPPRAAIVGPESEVVCGAQLSDSFGPVGGKGESTTIGIRRLVRQQLA